MSTNAAAVSASAPSVRPSDAAAAGLLPRKTFDIDLKVDDATGEFELYCAVFGNIDRQGDIIEPGAFDNLVEFTEDGWGAINHRSGDLPVAYVIEAIQDAKGLKIRGKFHSTPEAQACRTIVRERIAGGKRALCSLGYVTRDESWEKINGQTVRKIKRLSVYEFSFVNLPANPRAEVTSAKAAAPAAEKGKSTTMSTETKGGRLAKAHREKLAEMADAMDGHHEEMAKCVKGLREAHKAACATHAGFKEYMKAFEPDEDGDEDGDEEEAPRRKKKKTEKPEDTADGDPPKAASRESIARKLAGLNRS